MCSDGALLMAVSGEHVIVPGTLEFPSGFVDVGDFEGDKLDFDRYVEREVIEEFAMTRAQLGRRKQYLVSAADEIVQVISIFIAIHWETNLPEVVQSDENVTIGNR